MAAGRARKKHEAREERSDASGGRRAAEDAWPDETRVSASDAVGRTPDRDRETGRQENGAGVVPSGADIEDEIGGLRDELEELNAKWLRALADLDNYKKRMERERSNWDRAAREEILLSLLDVVDNFERAVSCGDAGSPPPDDPFRQGVELILSDLRAVLRKYGVEPIDTCGAEFDPALHEAVGQVESEDHESNQIVEEMRKGYMLGGRLLRCSRVIVAK